MPIDPGEVQWDAAPKIDPNAVKWDNRDSQGKTPDDYINALERNREASGAAIVRSLAGIGNTLLTPVRKAAEAVGPNPVAEHLGGVKGALNSLDEKYKDSGTYAREKLVTDLVATSGVGGVLAKGAQAAGMTRLGNALASGGMVTGAPAATTAAGRVADMGVRMAGGGASGGAMAGLIDPEQAKSGAVIGAAAPPVLTGLGKAGNALGKLVHGPAVSPGLQQAAVSARDLGYVVPPTQAKPSLVNRLLEGTAGKISTAQNASVKNQEVTNLLVKKDLGLAPDQQITHEALDGLRKTAGKAYEDIAKLGKLPVTRDAPAGLKPALNTAGEKTTKSLDARTVIEEWKQANHDATAYYRAYGRDANPETLAKAKAASARSKDLDSFLEKKLTDIGRSDLLTALKEARVQIAKTHSAEAALNPATGTVDAQKFAQMLDKGKKLSGGMQQAGEFAQAFKQAARAPEKMGGLPQFSPLDLFAGAMAGVSTQDPKWAALALLRPAARSAALSPLVQRGLTSAPQSENLLANPSLYQLLARPAPVLGSDR